VGDFTFARSSLATRVNSEGLIEEMAINIPRLDYSNDSCPELLLEPTRTNLLQRSEEFDNAYWTKTNSTISANAIISPDGTKTGDKLTDNSTNGSHDVRRTITNNIAIHTLSVFAKAGSLNWLKVFNGYTVSYFDLSTGTIGTSGASSSKIVDYGNGWYRCSVTDNYSSASSLQLIGITNDDNVSNYSGSGDTIYLFGAMIEEADYQTSYVKTTSSSVTRATETCNSSGDATTFNDLEGVLYAEISALFDDLTSRVLSISDGTTSNRVYISYSTTTNQILVDIIDGGVSQAAMTYTLSDETSLSKIAVKYKVNDCALWVDGVERDTDTTAVMPSGLNEFMFDDGAGDNDFYGRCKEIKVFKTALTDTELEELTT
jgi:hypothetical protein